MSNAVFLLREAIAVSPIATPIKNLRMNGSAIACRMGEAGCSNSVVNTAAEIMNRPKPAASIKYSG
jgi:hypothetical protein